MPKANVRLKVLKASRRDRHRYDLLRVLSQVISLGILLGVPLSGLARVDLWGDGHMLLFRPAPLKHAVAGVILAIAALYVFTFLANLVAGRHPYCGAYISHQWFCIALRHRNSLSGAGM